MKKKSLTLAGGQLDTKKIIIAIYSFFCCTVSCIDTPCSSKLVYHAVIINELTDTIYFYYLFNDSSIVSKYPKGTFLLTPGSSRMDSIEFNCSGIDGSSILWPDDRKAETRLGIRVVNIKSGNITSFSSIPWDTLHNVKLPCGVATNYEDTIIIK
jgi:hypothetical protein